MSTDTDIEYVGRLVDACMEYLRDQEPARQRALEYYNGEMNDFIPKRYNPDANEFEEDEARSKAVSPELRIVIKKLMPSIMRTFFGNDTVVKFTPKAMEDEDGAKAATDYINTVTLSEAGAEKAIYDAIFDAMCVKTGILKWQAYRQKTAEIKQLRGQPKDAILGLEGDGIEIIDLEETPEGVDVKLRRVIDDVHISLDAVPRGSFLIYPNAESIADAPIVGEVQRVSRSELISRGYERELVDAIRTFSASDRDDDSEARAGDDYSTKDIELRRASQIVEIYEVYVRLDTDDDGIAELHKIVFGREKGGSAESGYVVLESEPAEEAPYADIVIERDAHQFEGRSMFEDMESIQKIKTFFLRCLIDYNEWVLNPVVGVDVSGVEDPNQLVNRGFLEPVVMTTGRNINEVLQLHTAPNLNSMPFDMLNYFDKATQDRTGVSDMSGGMTADMLQNVAATTAQIMQDKGVAQSDMIVRNIAKGLKRAFRGLLRLVVVNGDKVRSAQVGGEWKTFDPSQWNADMDCVVNIGLGTGSKERDLAVLQMIEARQKEIMMTLGPENPIVRPEQYYNTLEQIATTAGLPSADPYFTEPDPAEIERLKAERANQPNPEMLKIQHQMQLEEMKAQGAERKEIAQLQADMEMERLRQQTNLQKAQIEMETKRAHWEWQSVQNELDRDLKRELQGSDHGFRLDEASLKTSGATVATTQNILTGLSQQIGEMVRVATMPKRIVRDMDGSPIGVEPVVGGAE